MLRLVLLTVKVYYLYRDEAKSKDDCCYSYIRLAFGVFVLLSILRFCLREIYYI